MKKRWLALVLALLLLPIAAWAQEIPVEEETLRTLDPEIQAYVEKLLSDVLDARSEEEQIELLLAAADEHPDNPDVLLICAQLLFYTDLQGAYQDRCFEMLDTALELADDELRPMVIQSKAEQLIYNDRLDEAVTILTEALEKSPEIESLKVSLSNALYYSGEEERATQLLEDLLEDSPTNMEARTLRASFLLEECKWDEALQAYEQIADEWPEYADGLLGQLTVYYQSGQFEQAIRVIDRLLSAGIGDSMWVQRARIRLWNQYEPDYALQEVEALLRMDPEWVEASVIKLVALVMIERYDDARAVADGIVALDASYGELMHAIVLMNESRWAEAEERIDALIASDPQYYAAPKTKATIRLQGFDDAEGAMQAMADSFAITEGEGDMDMFQQLGHIYLRQGEYQEAARAFAAGDMRVYDDPAALYYLAMACIDAGKLQDLQDVVLEMERRYPGWYETMLARVLLNDTLVDSEGALEAFEALKEKFPFPAQNLVTLEGMLLADNGDAGGAALIEKQLNRDDSDSGMWDAYAYALAVLGEHEPAVEALAEAEKRLPEMEGETMDSGRLARISLHTSAMHVYMHAGDHQAVLEHMQAACELGWSLHSVLLNDRFAEVWEMDGFDALMKTQPEVEAQWDLSMMPTIPGQ